MADYAETRIRRAHTSGEASRRQALYAVAGAGQDDHVPERFRAVLYVNGAQHTSGQQMSHLMSYLTARYWVQVGFYFDDRCEQAATPRPGLLAAVERIKLGDATALVMISSDYGALPDGLRSWLEIEVQRFAGFVSQVPSDDQSPDGSQLAKAVHLDTCGQPDDGANDSADGTGGAPL